MKLVQPFIIDMFMPDISRIYYDMGVQIPVIRLLLFSLHFRSSQLLRTKNTADNPQAGPHLVLDIQKSGQKARYSKHIIRDMLCKSSLK